MNIQNFPSDRILSFDLVIPSLFAANAKQAWKAVSVHTAPLIGIKDRILKDRLIEQDKHTPSALGDGCALSHLRIGSLQKSIIVFARLKTPLDFGAADGKRVDLLAIVLSPEREGALALRNVARLSRLLRNTLICDRLRASSDEKEMRALLEHSSVHALAA
jgi:nitrogen PTS system EIIA component